MPFPSLIKNSLLSICCLLFAGCRIIQVAEPGGAIVSSSGYSDCSAGSQCYAYVPSGVTYSEVFTAVPEPGYLFAGWKRSPGHLCADELGPCVVFNIPPTLTALDFDMWLVAQFVEDSAQISSLPASINWGQTLDVKVSPATDSNLANLEFAYGPPGMSLDSSGRLTWKAENVIMFGDSQQIHFGIRDRANGGAVDEFSIELKDNRRERLVVSSGIEVPRDEYSIWVGQYDDDPQPEILLSDSGARIMTVEYRNGEVVQDWLYPFAFEDDFAALQVIGADLNGDGINEIIALSERSIYLIEGRDTPASLIYTTEDGRLEGATVANIDGDSALEILALRDGYPEALLVIDTGTQEVEREIEVSLRTVFEGNFPQVGNVDQDPALEVVLRDGYVIDLASGNVQWDLGEPFGNLLTLADVNGDGISEIFATETWGNPMLYDAIQQTDLWLLPLDTSNRCSVGAADLDGDNNDELLLGECQGSKGVKVYQATRGSVSEWLSIPERMSGVASLTSGDVDGDGDLDLAFSTGISSSRYNALGLATLEGSAASFIHANDPAQLLQIEAAGVTQTPQGEHQGVYVVARNEAEDEGQRLATLDGDGSLSVGSVISENWEAAGIGVVSDYDRDGRDEILLGSQLRYDDSLQVIELETGITEWSFPWSGFPNGLIDLTHADMNGDGYDDVVAQRGSRLYVLDPFNQTELWSSEESGQAAALAVGDINGDGIPEIIESVRENFDPMFTRYWQRQAQDGSYALGGAVPGDVQCSRIEVADVDDQPGVEIICLTYLDWTYRAAEIRVLDQSFREKWSIAMPYAVRDFALQPGDDKPVNILVAVIQSGSRECTGSCSGEFQIRSVSLDTGKTVWVSPALLDEPTRRSLHPFTGENAIPRLVFSATNVMYITPAPAGSR